MGCTQSMKEDSDYTYDSTWESDDNNTKETQTRSKKIKKKNLQFKRNSCVQYKKKRKQKHQSSKPQTRRAYRNVQAAKDMQTYRHKCRAFFRQHLKRDNEYKLGHTQSQKRVRRPSALTRVLWCGGIKQIWNSRSPETSPKSTERERVHGESEGFLRNKVGKKRRYTETSCDDDDDLPNIQFYRNKIKFIPDGVTIDDIHNHWDHDYQKLEKVHSYIQWLFPLQEQGVNPYATTLTEKEIKLFHEDEEVKKRLLTSYKVMLNFYGIKLLNEETGEVDRRRNWRERFENLNRNTHNNLRITRILKCLGLLGFDHYQPPLVKFFLNETLVRKTLPRVKQSVLDYFMFTVLDKEKRKKLIAFAFNNFEPKEDFVWCPRRIHKKLSQEHRRTSTK